MSPFGESHASGVPRRAATALPSVVCLQKQADFIGL